jgi:hypothetical protein
MSQSLLNFVTHAKSRRRQDCLAADGFDGWKAASMRTGKKQQGSDL